MGFPLLNTPMLSLPAPHILQSLGLILLGWELTVPPQILQAVAPVWSWYVPAGQSVQADAPAPAAYVPASQGVHRAATANLHRLGSLHVCLSGVESA